MTEAPSKLRRGSAICGSVFLLALLMHNAETAIAFVRQGLRLCAETVIPSLFPFLVISALFVNCGAADWFGRLLAGPMSRLFGVSGVSAGPILLGALCGFPIGARTAAALYDRGSIGRNELEHLMTFCNNTGSAFVISAVGTALWNAPAFGVGLYWIQLGAGLLIGLLGRRRLCPERRPTPAVSPCPDLSSAVCDAIPSSATGMLAICAYVVFFSSMVGTCLLIFDRFCTAPLADALFLCFFELSSGSGAAASLGDIRSGAILTAFAVGWSGMSVHFQVMSAVAGRGISFRPYLLAKTMQGVFCAGVTAVWIQLAPPAEMMPRLASEAFSAIRLFGTVPTNLFFAVSLLWAFGQQIFRKISDKIL